MPYGQWFALRMFLINVKALRASRRGMVNGEVGSGKFDRWH
jgi:hypothetical protein